MQCGCRKIGVKMENCTFRTVCWVCVDRNGVGVGVGGDADADGGKQPRRLSS